MKKVLITGVTGGIGAASARLFKEAGWQVFGVDLVAARPSSDGLDRLWQGDVAEEGFWEGVVESGELAGGLHALVNNAATQLNASLIETSAADWDRTLAVNLKAPFLAMKHLSPLLAAVDGAVVNVSSVHAVATSRNIAAYAASKGGLTALTRAAALDLAERRIRVNAVLPGATDTGMLEAGLGRGHLSSTGLDDLKRELAANTPCGRLGQPVEIAQMILFLADGDRSSFVTGQSFIVDGGALAGLSTE